MLSPPVHSSSHATPIEILSRKDYRAAGQDTLLTYRTVVILETPIRGVSTLVDMLKQSTWIALWHRLYPRFAVHHHENPHLTTSWIP